MSVYSGPADWWTEDTDEGRIHIATKGIPQANLVLNLDAGCSTSYPGSGTSWTDLTGINSAATLTSTTYDPDNGGTIIFNNSSAVLNGSVSIPQSSSSVSFWLYLDSAIDWNARFDVFANDIATATNGRFILYRFDTTTLRIQATFPSLTVYALNITSANSLFTGKWNHIVMTTNTVSTTTTIDIYINGLFYDTLSVPEAATATATGIVMMRNVSAGTYPTNGKLATVEIYNRALTDSEIMRMFNALRNRFGV